MGGLFKNLLVSAGVVVAGTAATTGVAGLAIAILASVTSNNYDFISQAGAGVLGIGVAVGIFFSVVSLAVALLTMPPVLGLTHLLKLPRPVADMVGGAGAGWLCAAIALNGMVEMTRAKGGSPPDDTMTYLLLSCGTLGGLLMGYWRHAILVRSPIQLIAKPLAA